ncbi:MAG TPA: hypothetical protein VMA35_10485 [Candidatus Sulfopaludibacter sp.]|nr:hypothetical protein [Candidatus Sulfopaludibacter sp.]
MHAKPRIFGGGLKSAVSARQFGFCARLNMSATNTATNPPVTIPAWRSFNRRWLVQIAERSKRWVVGFSSYYRGTDDFPSVLVPLPVIHFSKKD